MEKERTQSEANLENSEGQWEGLPHSDKKGSLKELEEEHSDRRAIDRLTDCKIQPKGQTQTQYSQRYWMHLWLNFLHRNATFPFTHVCGHAIPSDQLSESE